MRPQPGRPDHEFLIAGVPESWNITWKPAACGRSTYKLNVVDLPGVKKIRVTYHFPAWPGMKDAVEDPGGDLRAVEGTSRRSRHRDRPAAAQRRAAAGRRHQNRLCVPARATGVAASVPIQKDGMYHIAAVERREDVRLTDDYFIEARRTSRPR